MNQPTIMKSHLFLGRVLFPFSCHPSRPEKRQTPNAMSDKTAAGVAKIRHIETLAPENLRTLKLSTMGFPGIQWDWLPRFGTLPSPETNSQPKHLKIGRETPEKEAKSYSNHPFSGAMYVSFRGGK